MQHLHLIKMLFFFCKLFDKFFTLLCFDANANDFLHCIDTRAVNIISTCKFKDCVCYIMLTSMFAMGNA